MKKLNEQNACDAFITILRSLTDIKYVESESPDELNRSTPDIDFVLVSSRDENDKIAVEHTIVEFFDGQIEYVKRSYDIVDLINTGCRKRLPGDRYYILAVPPIIVDSLVTKRSRAQFVSDLSSWVVKTAPKLLLVDSSEQTEYKGHKIRLTCGGDGAQMNGNVGRIPQQPENQKALQSERLRRAVSDKLPKLMKYKQERGFKTALLLEGVAGNLSVSTLRGCEISLEEVDYIVVFVSNENRMIIGNVLKEGSVWYSFVPVNRRFSFNEVAGGADLTIHKSMGAPGPDFRTWEMCALLRRLSAIPKFMRAVSSWLLSLLIAATLAVAAPLPAQQPDPFRWMDFHAQKDQDVIVWVTRSLESEKWTAIREIGVEYDAALVVTTLRATPQSPANADTFTVWNVSLTSHVVAPLLTGVNLRWLDWMRFLDGAPPEPAVLYDNCSECAANTYFTAFYYDLPHHMWTARWMRGGQGVPVWTASTPAGVAWTQVYAGLAEPNGREFISTWNHFDYGPQKPPNDFIYRYDLDPFSRLERTKSLSGKDADAMKQRLCRVLPAARIRRSAGSL